MHEYRIIRRNGRAFHMTIPIEFVRAFGLDIGDTALWSAEGDVVTLRFFKLNSTPAQREHEGAVVEAT